MGKDENDDTIEEMKEIVISLSRPCKYTCYNQNHQNLSKTLTQSCKTMQQITTQVILHSS